ncbi:hypothetical protein HV135_11820 [Citrobacter sp. RHBSTW-00229]|nr:hypothetical protein HV135_11820 [Citrobacter sp. RHBSTW-00229]
MSLKTGFSQQGKGQHLAHRCIGKPHPACSTVLSAPPFRPGSAGMLLAGAMDVGLSTMTRWVNQSE